jgi:cell division protein FtsL
MTSSAICTYRRTKNIPDTLFMFFAMPVFAIIIADGFWYLQNRVYTYKEGIEKIAIALREKIEREKTNENNNESNVERASGEE